MQIVSHGRPEIEHVSLDRWRGVAISDRDSAYSSRAAAMGTSKKFAGV
jgi:hypothetical protein